MPGRSGPDRRLPGLLGARSGNAYVGEVPEFGCHLVRPEVPDDKFPVPVADTWRMKTTRVLPLAVFFVALAAAYALGRSMGEKEANESLGEPVMVVVATEDIPAGAELDPLIEDGAFKRIEVPGDVVVPGAATAVWQLRGMETTSVIGENEQIWMWRLTKASGLSREVLHAIGPWYDVDGRPLPSEEPFVLRVWQGSAHCDWQDVLVLELAWPIGSEIKRPTPTDDRYHAFVRLPKENDERESGFRPTTTFDPTATLPDNAYYAGYQREGWRLWVSDERIDQAVWLVRKNRVERWPAVDYPPLCI